MPQNERFAVLRSAAQLTEGQVAEFVAQHVWQRTGRRPPIDADHVGRIERGVITWPGQHYREAFRAVFCVKSDAELGFFARRGKPGGATAGARVDVDGQLLALTAVATIGAVDGSTLTALSASLVPGTPKRIGRVDVADLHQVIDGMERADHAAGGRTVVRSLALGQLTWAQDTLQRASFRTADVRKAWMVAVARLGRLAGFMSMDARDHETARRCFLIALQIAADAQSWPSRLNVLSGMARQAVHLGDGTTALQMTTLVQAGERSASATTRAMLRVLEARAYGLLGRADEATTAVGQAEVLYAQRCPEDDPPWLWFYDDAQLLGDTGHALYPLALANADIDAARRLRLAVDQHDPGDTRGRAFSLVKLATLEVRHEPADAAYATVRNAITAVAGLRSGRALDFLADLGRVLRHVGTTATRELAGEVSRTLKTARED
jgi:hypothetical protein